MTTTTRKTLTVGVCKDHSGQRYNLVILEGTKNVTNKYRRLMDVSHKGWAIEYPHIDREIKDLMDALRAAGHDATESPVWLS